jgi:hypothetical protein
MVVGRRKRLPHLDRQRYQGEEVGKSRVEERRGPDTELPARFLPPLIKPDVPISSIRLSDRVLTKHTQ